MESPILSFLLLNPHARWLYTPVVKRRAVWAGAGVVAVSQAAAVSAALEERAPLPPRTVIKSWAGGFESSASLGWVQTIHE